MEDFKQNFNQALFENIFTIKDSASTFVALNHFLVRAIKNGKYQVSVNDIPKDSLSLLIQDELLCLKDLSNFISDENTYVASYHFKKKFDDWAHDWIRQLNLNNPKFNPGFIKVAESSQSSSMVNFKIEIKLNAG